MRYLFAGAVADGDGDGFSLHIVYRELGKHSSTVLAIAVIAIFVLGIVFYIRSGPSVVSGIASGAVAAFKWFGWKPHLLPAGNAEVGALSSAGNLQSISQHSDFAALAESLSNFHVGQLFNALMDIDSNVRKILSADKFAPSKISAATLSITLIRSILSQAEKCFRLLLADNSCVVSLKTRSTDNKDKLTCRYSNSGYTDGLEHRLDSTGKLEPIEIPIEGTLPGRVIGNGKPRFLSNIDSAESRIISDEEVTRLKVLGIGSMAAWPVRISNENVAALVVDSRRPNAIRSDCPISALLLKYVTLKIGMVLAFTTRECAVVQSGKEQSKKKNLS